MICPNCKKFKEQVSQSDASPYSPPWGCKCDEASLAVRRLGLDPQHGQAVDQIPALAAPRPDERITVEDLKSWMNEKGIF